MNLVCDLGTANFRAAVIGGNQVLNEPCVVAYDKSGKIVVGDAAYQMMGRNPDIIEVVTPMEAGGVLHFDAVVEIIRHCVKSLGTSRFARKFSLTFSIPAGLTQVEIRALEDAGKSAGANHVQFMNASVAAAVAAKLPIENPTGCLVVNMGAGITEASLLSMKGVVASHRLRHGGRIIDETILERIKKDHRFLVGLRSVEELKHHMCSELEMSGTDVRGRNLLTGLPDSLYIPRSVVEEEVSMYCDSIVDLIGQVITSCPPELAGDVVEHGVTLVGGGAQIGGIVDQLTSRLEIPVLIPEEPDTCVVRGLLQSGWLKRPKAGATSYFRKKAPLQEVRDGQ